MWVYGSPIFTNKKYITLRDPFRPIWRFIPVFTKNLSHRSLLTQPQNTTNTSPRPHSRTRTYQTRRVTMLSFFVGPRVFGGVYSPIFLFSLTTPILRQSSVCGVYLSLRNNVVLIVIKEISRRRVEKMGVTLLVGGFESGVFVDRTLVVRYPHPHSEGVFLVGIPLSWITRTSLINLTICCII